MPPNKPPKSPPPPPLTPTRGGNLVLSLEFFREREPFALAAGGVGYFAALLARLRDICTMPADAVRANRSPSLRHHRIHWADTTEPAGFDHINATMRNEVVPCQFTVSANEYGLAHGFWVADTFYVVWLDPAHALYA